MGTMGGRRRSRWAQMTRAQRLRWVAITSAQAGFMAFGLVKLSRRPAERIPGRKWLWALVILANLAASVAIRFGRLAADPRPAEPRA